MLLSKQNQFLLNRRILGLHQQFKQPNGHDDMLNASGGNLVFHQIDQNMLSKPTCAIEWWRELGENIMHITFMKKRMTLENFGGRSTRYYTEFLMYTSMPTTSALCHSFATENKIRMKFCDPKHNVPHIPPPQINFQMTSCDLDPLPTKLLKCLDILLTPITNIVNLSLESSSFPDVLKVSLITPLLKKLWTSFEPKFHF